jgi:streptogramin lyase
MFFLRWRRRLGRVLRYRRRRARIPRSARFRPEVTPLEERCVLSPVINEFPIPTNGNPIAMTSGPDGNLWFVEREVGKVGRITTAGVVTEFALPPGDIRLQGIALGLDGNLWFTEEGVNRIGRITPCGTLTEYPVPTPDSRPTFITAGPDGNLWFTEDMGNQIGQITTAGVITEFPVPTRSAGPTGITAGPDGNVWFTENSVNQIGRITPAGVITEFPVFSSSTGPTGITTGPDGNLWFTENRPGFSSQGSSFGLTNQIGRITTAGVVTLFTIPTTDAGPTDITTGPDGNLWFTEETAGQIGQITPAGVITEFPVPTSGSQPDGITLGPDNNLWFVEFAGNKIAQIVFQPTPAPPVASTNQGFVMELYQDLLHRQADPGGLSHWTVALNQGQLTRAQVVQHFLASPEYQTRVVQDLYHMLLRRAADAGGLSIWTNFLAQGGTAEQVEAQLLSSPEYFGRRGGGTTNGFLAAVFQDVLGRTVDPVGAQMWNSQLASGASRLAVVAGILASSEAQQDQVQALYCRLLHRIADNVGLNTFTTFLQSAGLGVAIPPFNQQSSGFGGFLGNPPPGTSPSSSPSTAPSGSSTPGGTTTTSSSTTSLPASLEQVLVDLASSPEYFGQIQS